MSIRSPRVARKPAEKPARTVVEPDLAPLRRLLGYHLRRAQLAVFQHFAATMGAANITPGQYGVLAMIDANPGLSQTQLGTALGIDRSTVVGVIDRLETRGLVLREPAPNDRRSHALRLSPAGMAMFRRLEERVRAHERQIAQDLSASERTLLIDLLRRIARPPA
jgi:DNA-binding MarR family transcriptional regulator